MENHAKAVVVLVVTFTSLVAFSCEIRGTSEESLTLTRLNFLRALTEDAVKKGLGVENVTVNEVLEYAVSHGITSRELLDGRDLRTDIWGTQVHMISSTKNGGVEFRFISAGRNRIYEHGLGDDVVLTCVIKER
jgi:hypothetical protein